MLSGLLATTVNAAIWPNLPSTVVQLTVVDDTTSYFDSTLSGVPAGFDVDNGVYPGWCIDRSTTMIRSSPHDVILYSSLSPTAAAMSGIDFDKINYILNNKQGSMMDVQQAIWFFTGEFAYIDLSTDGKAMVDAAEAATFDPITAPVLAVICLPQEDPNPQNAAQISIIELTRSGCGLSPGFWKHNVGVYLGERRGSYSNPEGSSVVSKGTMEAWLAGLGLDLPELYNDLNTKGGGATGAATRVGASNIFNALAGLQPYSD
jgi:hypothetical protein